jgi:hypothetical protein
VELRWKVNDSASCFHAAAALAGGRTLVDTELAVAIEPTLAGLLLDCREQAIDGAKLLELLAMLGAEIDNNQRLARTALSKLDGYQVADTAAAALARHITALESAYLKLRPQVAQELTLRSGPLQMQWEARGSGLLKQIERLTDPLLVPAGATVILVQPVLGGAGAALVPFNLVRIEAVIADPHPALPEIVRLAWLLAQLNLDLPIFEEQAAPAGEQTIARDRLFELGALALLPVVLTGAQEIELIRDASAAVAPALQTWKLAEAGAAESLAGVLLAWWKTYHVSRPPWGVALAALQQLLEQAASSPSGDPASEASNEPSGEAPGADPPAD